MAVPDAVVDKQDAAVTDPDALVENPETVVNIMQTRRKRGLRKLCHVSDAVHRLCLRCFPKLLFPFRFRKHTARVADPDAVVDEPDAALTVATCLWRTLRQLW